MTISKFKGGKELQAMLNSLPAKIEANIMRSALRAGAKVIAQEAKAQVPVDAGDLKRSIKVKSRRMRKGQARISVVAGDKKAFYAHMIEFGTRPHEIKPRKGGKGLSVNGKYVKKVNHPGIKPKPFMRLAMDSKQQQAVVAVGEQIKRRLNKEGIEAAGGLDFGDDE